MLWYATYQRYITTVQIEEKSKYIGPQRQTRHTLGKDKMTKMVIAIALFLVRVYVIQKKAV
jgi:hypothetical protein